MNVIIKLKNWWKSFKEWYRLKKKTKADWYEFFPVPEDFKDKVIRDKIDIQETEEARERYMKWVQEFHDKLNSKK